MGKPVVAFDVGGVAEMLDGRTGELVAFEARGAGSATEGASPARGRSASPRPSSATRATRLCGRGRGRPGASASLRDFDARAHARRIQREIVAAAGLTRRSPAGDGR